MSHNFTGFIYQLLCDHKKASDAVLTDEGVSAGTFQAEHGHDVARIGLLQLLELGRMHAAEFLRSHPPARARINEGVAAGQLALVNAHVGELAEASGLQLKSQTHERRSARPSGVHENLP